MRADGFAGALPLARFGASPRAFPLRADAATCARLAARFDLVAVHHLSADLEAWRADGGVAVTGRVSADVVQSCVVSAAPVPAHVDEPIAVRFLPQASLPAEEIELDADELDVLSLLHGEVDLGELVAQSLYLALDPYPLAKGTMIEEARHRLGRGRSPNDREDAVPASPFAKLKGL